MQLLTQRRQHFGDGVVVVDCGANIGVHTVAWAKGMTGWGQVLAIEAQERIFYALAGNITINNCFNARAFNAAVGAADGVLRVPSRTTEHRRVSAAWSCGSPRPTSSSARPSIIPRRGWCRSG